MGQTTFAIRSVLFIRNKLKHSVNRGVKREGAKGQHGEEKNGVGASVRVRVPTYFGVEPHNNYVTLTHLMLLFPVLVCRSVEMGMQHVGCKGSAGSSFRLETHKRVTGTTGYGTPIHGHTSLKAALTKVPIDM